jgi:hypothetical protein
VCEGVDWVHNLARDTAQWRALVGVLVNFPVSFKAENLTS